MSMTDVNERTAWRALANWKEIRTRRLNELYDAHASVEGTGPGRRWRTSQLNRMLVMALSAEFQGFTRDLHDEGTNAFLAGVETIAGESRATMLSTTIRPLLLTQRRIDRGDPDPSALAEDFDRFGLSWWTVMTEHDRRTPSRQEHLRMLMIARNGIAHADDTKLDMLKEHGYPMTLRTVRRWHRAVDALATTMDEALRHHLRPLLKEANS